MNKKTIKIIISVMLDIVLLFLLVVAVFLGYFKLSYTEAYVIGPSMYPTLNVNADDKDIVAIHKNSAYTYGDIITATHKKNNNTVISVIKRVIALEGDYVDIDYNANDELIVILNCKELVEPYIENRATRVQNPIAYTNWQEYIMLAGEKYEAGKGLLVGKDEVFVLGDNRLVSNDSSAYGAINRSTVQGKVDFVYRKGENDFISFIKKMIFKMK